MSARQAGGDVLAVERAVAPGGTSASSGGLIYLGGGTALQRACGFDDSSENMAAFLTAALGPGSDDERLRAYCEGSPEHFDWLVSIGVPFRAAFCDEPNRESADDAGLLFSGGEDTYPFDEIALAVPRGHKPQYIDSAGGFLMERLVAAVSASGARVSVDSRAEALVTDGGQVVGVRVQTEEGVRTVRARGGVILASGGFIHNDAMVAEECPSAHVPDAAWRIGNPNDDGRGIRMGVGAGAAAARLESFECALPLGPPHRLARGILVNRRGERFINEDAYTGRIGLHALRDQDGFVHMITDDAIHEPNILGLRITFAAATPEELAEDLGVPADALARTVRDYNEAALRGEDPEFHKRAPFLQPIGVPPASGIGAIDLRVDHGTMYATFTLGGLATDAPRRRARQLGGASRVSTRPAARPPAWRLATTPAASASVTARSSAAALAVMPPSGPGDRVRHHMTNAHHPHGHAPTPRYPDRHRFALGGERSPVDMVTAVLIDAKLELMDERRIAQSEVMT